ncbi:baseplate wedge subunit [Aeromonas phage phiAS5]|uniref:Baseplate wedge protein gp6 n=1 Tax=Aeromonas phage phiAS5 TaxID=879630 RepID=E1A291_9CAUD|nr:baseplate wedge subunit [Aeromonas phage phiAS5]ADM80180.1 baseplate wedge subunit [Aeromonas phage phiAS5]BES53057.1 hypothetical protein [Aeromonas phage phiWae14]
MANGINAVDLPKDFSGASFEQIKLNLIRWLQNQDEFKDYNFAGSRMSVLVDLLTYATLYIQQFGNAAVFESFLRLAQLRSSVVQHVQDMGYLPSTASASGTTVRFTGYYSPIESSPISITIPKGTKFTGSIEDVDFYDYVTWDDVQVIRGINNRYITDLALKQGRIIRQELIYQKDSIIEINDKSIDRNYVRVFVDGAPWTDWTTKPLVTIGGTSTVFYQRETIDGYTEIFFGEGEKVIKANGQLSSSFVGGLKPSVGSTIVIEYLSTDGTAANGCRNFAYVDTIPNIVVEKIEENPTSTLGKLDPGYTGAAGGGGEEDIERLRELGPIMRETQRRAVTRSDYEAFVNYRFGNIVQAVQCYTDSEKPGYAFIAIKPKDGLYLTTVQKEDIQNFLRDYNVATITPVVHSPNYLYVKSNVKVTYAMNNLSQTEEWLQGKVLDAIDRYYIEEVEIFNRGFYTSKLNGRIDDADISILGTTTSIGLVREVENFYSSPMIGVKYMNQVTNGSVYSSDIKYTPRAGTSYGIHYVGTRKNNVAFEGKVNANAGLTLVGPFAAGDVTGVAAYTGTDFDRKVISGRSLYYAVGEVDYVADEITFDLGVLNQNMDKFSAAYIEFHATPVETNIYTSDGTMIVFENNLRPQYTTIQMEAVVR